MEIPELVKLHKEFQSRGVEMIGLSTEDPVASAESVSDFIREYNVDYQIGWAKREVAQTLMQGRTSIPQSFIIARDGRIVRRFIGFRPDSRRPNQASTRRGAGRKRVRSYSEFSSSCCRNPSATSLLASFFEFFHLSFNPLFGLIHRRRFVQLVLSFNFVFIDTHLNIPPLTFVDDKASKSPVTEVLGFNYDSAAKISVYTRLTPRQKCCAEE